MAGLELLTNLGNGRSRGLCRYSGDASFSQEIFDVAVTQVEPELELTEPFMPFTPVLPFTRFFCVKADMLSNIPDLDIRST